MNNENAPPTALLDQLIAILLSFFGVPLAFALRVVQRHVSVKRRFARLLEICKHRRIALRYDGEDDATVQARIALLDWLAKDPWKARRHLARRRWGLRAFFWAQFGLVPAPVVGVWGDALADACGFELPALDTS